jgi:hypothetical protein
MVDIAKRGPTVMAAADERKQRSIACRLASPPEAAGEPSLTA